MHTPQDIRQAALDRLLDIKVDITRLAKLPLIDLAPARSTKEVYVRAIIHAEMKALTIYPDTFEDAVEWMAETGLRKYLSKSETASLSTGHFTEQEEVNYSWYSESLYMFMKILGLVKKEFGPHEEADMEPHVGIFPPNSSLKKLEAAIKRVSDEELFVLLDTYYLLHWLARHGAAGFDHSVVMERRKALEWMADGRLDWDDVPLDT